MASTKKAEGIPEWKIIVAVIAVVAIVLTPVLAYSMPWSKIKVIITNNYYGEVGVDVFIDGILKASVGVGRGTSIVGVWPVDAGTHTVQIDSGDWYYYDGWFSSYWSYSGPDGYADFTYAYEVGPLYTKNVFISLS